MIGQGIRSAESSHEAQSNTATLTGSTLEWLPKTAAMIRRSIDRTCLVLAVLPGAIRHSAEPVRRALTTAKLALPAAQSAVLRSTGPLVRTLSRTGDLPVEVLEAARRSTASLRRSSASLRPGSRTREAAAKARMAVEALPCAARSLREQVRERANALEERRRVDYCKKVLGSEPENTALLSELGTYYERKGDNVQAANYYKRVLGVHRSRRHAEEAALFCSKLERVGCNDTAHYYRDIAMLYSEMGRYAEAARACRRVVENYCSRHEFSAASGYLRSLPPLGLLEPDVRAELKEYIASKAPAGEGTGPLTGKLPGLVEAQTAPSRQTQPLSSSHYAASTRRLTGPLTHAAAAAAAQTREIREPLVLLRGQLEETTPDELIGVVQANRITGRIDLSINELGAAIFLSTGRIIAARVGTRLGYPALSKILSEFAGPFQIVETEVAVSEQFENRPNEAVLAAALEARQERRKAPRAAELPRSLMAGEQTFDATAPVHTSPLAYDDVPTQCLSTGTLYVSSKLKATPDMARIVSESVGDEFTFDLDSEDDGDVYMIRDVA